MIALGLLVAGAAGAALLERERTETRALKLDPGRPQIDVRFVPDPEPPKECEVWLHNDNTVDGLFVAQILGEVFRVPQQRAFQVMMAAHRQGQGLVMVTGDCTRARALVDEANRRASDSPMPPFAVDATRAGFLFSVEERDAD